MVEVVDLSVEICQRLNELVNRATSGYELRIWFEISVASKTPGMMIRREVLCSYARAMREVIQATRSSHDRYSWVVGTRDERDML